VVQDRHPIIHITWLWSIGRKFEIGIRTSFQIYEASRFFFKFTDRTPKRVVDFPAAAPASDKGPLAVAPVMDDQKVRDTIDNTHWDRYGFMPLSGFEPWGHSRFHPLLRFDCQKNLGHCPHLSKIYSNYRFVDYMYWQKPGMQSTPIPKGASLYIYWKETYSFHFTQI
jgi:hypothetical protein